MTKQARLERTGDGASVPRESDSPQKVYADRPPIVDLPSAWPPPPDWPRPHAD